jgi:hypothetical protein
VTHGRTSDGIEIEMDQPIEGEVPDQIVLGEREGISHVVFAVDNLEQGKAKLAERGAKVVHEGTAPGPDWLFVADDRLAARSANSFNCINSGRTRGIHARMEQP